MALSMGLDESKGRWKTCLTENGQTVELCSFVDAKAVLAYLGSTCAFYPEPTIALSSGFGTPLTSLYAFTEQHFDVWSRDSDVSAFLIALGSMNLNSYSLPSVQYLPTIPHYRKLSRHDLGTTGKLCAVAALLYRMREREADWSEMQFLYAEVGRTAKSILVVENGQIVNGIGESAGSMTYPGSVFIDSQPEPFYRDNGLEGAGDESNAELALWEGLAQDLGGLMAIHHCEDIVVTGVNKNAAIEKLTDIYQCYQFPYSHADQEGYEAALGAAIIAEGLYRPGIAAEVVEHLQIRHGSTLSIAQGQQERPLLVEAVR